MTNISKNLKLKAIEDLNDAHKSLSEAYKVLTGEAFDEQLARFQLSYAKELAEKALKTLKNNN